MAKKVSDPFPKSKSKHPNPEFNPLLPVSRANPIINLDIAIELRLKGLSYNQIAQYFNVSETAVIERLQGHISNPDDLRAYRKYKLDIWEGKQADLMKSFGYADHKKMSGLQKVTAWGIIDDKLRREKGLTTANIGWVDYTRDMADLDKEIDTLEAELGSESE
jgi:hypothetical protein